MNAAWGLFVLYLLMKVFSPRKTKKKYGSVYCNLPQNAGGFPDPNGVPMNQ